MAPLILGYAAREADQESNYLSQPAEVSGETTTHKAAKDHKPDDGFELTSSDVVSRPEPCYHPSQKASRRCVSSSSSTASVGTQVSGETMGAGPAEEVQILTADSSAVMEGVDMDVDESRNEGGEKRVDEIEDDDDDGLRMSSCHCPASDEDKSKNKHVNEDAVSEVEEANVDAVEDTVRKPPECPEEIILTVRQTTQEIVNHTSGGTQADVSSEYAPVTSPTGDPKTEDPPRENIAVLIRRKREDRLQRIELARAAESEVKRAEILMSASSKPSTPDLEPAPEPTPVPEPTVDKAPDFTPSPPGRRTVHARPKPRSYKRAHVLTVHWASSSTREPPPAVQELALVVKRVYGYGATHCALAPRRHAAGVLAGALAEVMDQYAGTKDSDGNSDTLVILHYVGASRTDADNFRIYPPTWPFRAPVVEVDLQSLLRDSLLSPSFPSDVLVMLDCQYACNIGGTPQAGKEILAACTEPTGFCIRTPTRDTKFTWTIARLLSQARYSLHPFTDQLEKALVEDGTHRKGRPARLPELAGLMVGNGPAQRHILLSPVVAPWKYWVGPEGESSSGSASSVGSARCSKCGTLIEEEVACRCKAGPITLEGGEEVAVDIELGEVVVGGLFVVGEE